MYFYLPTPNRRGAKGQKSLKRGRNFRCWREAAVHCSAFSKIARQCGILIQESAPSDSNLAHYWPIGSSSAIFATQSKARRTQIDGIIQLRLML